MVAGTMLLHLVRNSARPVSKRMLRLQEAAEEPRRGSRRNAARKDASMVSKDLVGRVFVQLVSIRST